MTTPTPERPENKTDQKNSWLRRTFGSAADGFVKVWQNPYFEAATIAGSAGLFGSSILLGTTFLSSPAILAGVALVSLIKTSEIVSDRAETIGKTLKLSPLMIGIGLGMITSLPELGVSIAGLLGGSPDIALGNGIGSNIANVGLILGLSAMLSPLHSKDKNWWFDAGTMGISTAFVAGNLALQHFGLFSGITMMGMLGAYFAGQYILDKKRTKDKAATPDQSTTQPEAEDVHHIGKTVIHDPPAKNPAMLKDILWGASAIGGLIGSASLLVTGGSAVAITLGVPASVVALFGFAIGTSLPELMVSMQAVARGNTALAVGNIVGSNIFNNLFVIGATNMAAALTGDGIKVPAAFAWNTVMGKVNDIAYSLSAIMPISFLTYNKLRHGHDGHIGRKQGFLMAASYAAFAGATFMLGGLTPDQTAAVTAAHTATAVVPPPPPVPS